MENPFSGIRHAVPDKAMQWIETGAALAALKTGGRAATRIVRRNPALAIAAVAGAGLVWLVARHRAKQHVQDETAGGKTTRVRARRVPRQPAAR